MKKTLYFAVAIILSVMLTACGQSDKTGKQSNNSNTNGASTENTDSTKNDDESKDDEVNNDDISSEDLFKELANAQSNLESFSASIKMDQDMDLAGETMATTSTIKMDYKSPTEFSQSITTNAEGENMTMDMYMVGDELYIHDITEDAWMKTSGDMLGQLTQLDESQTDPFAQITQLKEVSEHFEVKSEGNTYVLTIKAGGDEFNEFIKKSALEQLPGAGLEEDELLSGMSINSTDYNIVIDKETYFPITMKVFMDMTIDTGEEKLNMKQTMDMEYSNYNEVKEITLPKDAKEKAIDLTEQLEQ